ncbi:FAD-dependent monooxygenase [Kitasatospora sp. NPDC098663]|uniref:FAD-dependent monooxygenase n=1 Tax=Kitasatospora sp. NPDC098663 TaxID=3364096 RepID=UPI0038045226
MNASTKTADRTVLISGAGIAGPTLAYWLARHGFQPTVVERAAAVRSSGSPVDVAGRAMEVAERMGIGDRLRAAATQVTGVGFYNAAGRRVGRIDLRGLSGAARADTVELPRGDLAAIVHEASQDGAEFVFGDSIASLSQDEAGVDVTFEYGRPRRFALVVGADGLHSAVRRLAFGPEPGFVRHLGMYVATMPLAGAAGDLREVAIHNAPGRALCVHPGCGRPLAAFMVRSAAVPDFDHRDTEQHRRLLTAAFAGMGWRAPEMLAQVRESEELYFDAVSQVRLPQWSRGRVTLLGDAASCVSLFGGGSSLAMAGAYSLADALAADPADHRAALARYEAAHRGLVDQARQSVRAAFALLVPAGRGGILARNLATRLSPVVLATARAGSVLKSRATHGDHS